MEATKILYSQLDPRREDIRLLEIVSTDPTIVCRLSNVALLHNPAFDALSYTWGDASKTELITVDGCPTHVTINLARALRSVHHRWSSLDGRRGSPRLWADALCINQRDMKEKEYQIPLMRKIYTSAAVVYVWLGTTPEYLRGPFDAINTLAAAEHTCSQLSEQDQKSFLAQWPSKINLSDLSKSIGLLFDDEYWTRVWTFQEIVLGQQVWFVAGHETLPLESLIVAESFLRQYMETSSAYSMDLRKNSELWFATRRVFQLLSVIFDISEVKEMVEATSIKPTGDEPIQKLAFEDLGLLGFQMSRCCALATSRRATHPKDYVYGFSALLDMQLIPDYSPETSISSIYCDLMEQALSIGGNMCLLLLDTAGIGHSWDLLPGLPSWGPNFASVANASVLGTYQPLIKANWASFVGLHDDRPPTIIRTTGSLFCTAIVIDAISHVAEVVDQGLEDANWVRWLLEILLSIHLHDESAPIHIRSIVDAISKSTSTTHLFHPPTPNLGVVIDSSYAHHNMLMLVLTLEKLWDIRPPNIDKEPFLRALLPGFIDGWNKVTMLSAYETLRNSDPSYIKLLMRGWSEMCAEVKGLRLARTTANCFGLFPPRIQNGDLVAMINTCTNPAILRKMGNCYAFVGWCFISEYVDERTMDSLAEAGLGSLERIEIR
jgi:hypothetical protein